MFGIGFELTAAALRAIESWFIQIWNALSTFGYWHIVIVIAALIFLIWLIRIAGINVSVSDRAKSSNNGRF